MSLLLRSNDGREHGPFNRPVLVGRLEGDVKLYVSTVSRRHCRLCPTDEGWELTDLESCNGTFVNGQRIDQTVVRAGDVVRVGPYHLTVQEE